MINEIKLTKYYQNLANTLNDMIPIEWDKIVFFTENIGDFSSTNFLYYSNNIVGKGLEIPDDFNYSKPEEKNHEMNEEKLDEIIKNMRNEFINFDEEPFTLFTFVIDNLGNFEVKFSYTPHYYEIKGMRSSYGLGWALDSFGIEPIGDVDKKILQNYYNFLEKNNNRTIF